ncbi:MAG: hypothetical protein ACU0B8_02760 [Pseudooceanicola nanhaiensis]|jgi:hypothetical protein
MARQFDRIEDDHRRFIEAQHMFFVAKMPAYWREKNTLTLDGAPTGIVAGNIGPEA